MSLEVRIGIHTGLVIVGDVGGGDRREQLALGETPNVAARLQALAAPGAVVISGATHKLVRRLFACRDLGPQAIKGLAAPIQTYLVLREVAAGQRGEDPAAPLVPLIGRDPQVALLLDRWEDAVQGHGQVVLVTGEPGIGKSRLLEALRERLLGVPHTRLEGRCTPYHQASPMYLVVELLSRALSFRPDDSTETRLERLKETVAALDLPVAEAFPVLAALLALPVEGQAMAAWTPQRLKQKTFETVLVMIRALAARQPVVLVLEDLHWADASSLELLTLLVEQVATAAICAFCTARPEFRPPWAARSHTSQLTLNRLSRRHTETMAIGVARGKAMPPEVVREIVARADGIPLFVEELTKMVLESGLLRLHDDRYELTGPLPPLAIPMTLHDSLMARLDRLATVKLVAQLGAILGREFPYALLEAVAPMEPAALQRELGQLVDAELLYQRGVPPHAAYVFKHALIQEAAYQSLLKSTRQQYHQRAAQALEELFLETVASHPEVPAQHYTQAGLAGRAIPHWQRAGEAAVRRSANAEAIAHFTTGLELARGLPPTRDRARQELALLIALGPVLLATRGFAAPETVRTYSRAKELCDELGDTPEIFPALWGQWAFYQLQGKLLRAREIGEELLRLGRAARDPGLVLQAHHALWPAHFFRGDVAVARAHCEEGLALYDPDRHRSLAFLYGGHDAAVCGNIFAALALSVLGYPEQALAQATRGIELAERLAHPHSTTLALFFAAMTRCFTRDPAGARVCAESCIAMSTEHGFAQWLAGARVVRGWSRSVLEESDEGIAEMRQGVADWMATGATLYCSVFLGLIVETCLHRQRVDDGLAALREASALIAETGERIYEAEIVRLRGELALGRAVGDPIAAEAAFLEAIDVARHQEARSWELRSAASLARLWQRQGKRDEARRVLADAYAWFTEGFETPDLRAVQGLLVDPG